MPISSLPLINGALVFDNSTIELLRCPRLFQLQSLRKRVLATNKAGRNFGSTLHAGWATRYERCGVNAPTAMDIIEINNSMEQYLNENPQPEGDFRNFSHACNVMAAYNSIYGNEPFTLLTKKDGKPLVESSFMLPFCVLFKEGGSWKHLPWGGDFAHVASNEIPVFYSGKIDLGILNLEGIWSQDHKTTFQFGDTFQKQMQMDGGQLGYLWALLKATGQQPVGYIIDAVRVRKPSVKSLYAGESPVDPSDFMRIPYWKSAADIEEWQVDAMSLIARIVQMADDDYFPRHRWNCTNKFGCCDMFDVCSTPAASRENTLMSSLYEDNTWSPLKQAIDENGNKTNS